MARKVTVVGAGPAGLMAAEVLARGGLAVTIIDHMPSPGRKFLIAGRGGLNLTHSEPLEIFLMRYGGTRHFLEPIIRAFPPQAVIEWANGLGVETFIGSSGRVFPKSMKASPLLRAWLRRLDGLGVVLKSKQQWKAFDGTPTILAMGGASWPNLGSTAAWVPLLRSASIEVKELQPSNGRIRVSWSDYMKRHHAGSPIKNVKLRYRDAVSRGEIVISEDGLEGGAIYQLSSAMRELPAQSLIIDLKPGLEESAVAKRLAQPRGKMSQSNFLRKALSLSPAAIALLREEDAPITAGRVKATAVATSGFAGIDRAISSAGGIALHELDGNCQLKKIPLAYAVGEMLDWDGPTGGYLLQACFSTAVAAARDMLKRLA